MRLAAGARLGPYEVVALMGAGGMGEVYRAKDTRLGRDVAVKVLSPEIASSPEARQRFEREARTISQLSHPHICALFDVGEAESPSPGPQPLQYLVMELLEGETLARRVASGALPLETTLQYATQIASALDTAHRAGIVHRDLKPANVMLTRTGVKLLDFGLAKAMATSAVGLAETMPAVPPISAHGAIAGTVQYMAPELLAGGPADARSDIYAFGAVVYEMAAGRAAFGTSIAPIRPAALDRLVRACLAADPGERWQSAHDLRLQLRAIAETTDQQDAAAPSSAGTRGARLPWTVAAIATLAAAAALLAVAWRAPQPAAPGTSTPGSVRFLIPPPEGGAFSDTVESVCIALSPDGSQLAYVASDAGGVHRVWLRPMSAVEGRPVAGTDGARTVLWSPDGKSIAFFSGDKLMRLDVPDGTPVTLANVPDVNVFATWGDGQVLFALIPGGLFRVPASGGAMVKAVTPDPSRGEVTLSWPWFLPDGRRFLYLARRGDGGGTLMVSEPDKPAREVLAGVVSNAQYVEPGYLVFARDGTLVAQRFDVVTARTTGEPFAIAEPVRYFYSTGAATFATSRSGGLVYQPHAEGGRLVWLDRTGRELGAIGEPAQYMRPRISGDGGRVLFSRAEPRIGTYDLWLYDVGRGVEQRLTSDRLSEFAAVWLPGGTSMIFSQLAPPRLFRKDLAAGEAVELLQPPLFRTAEDVSPDGRTLIFVQRTLRGTFDMWKLALDGSRAAAPLMETPFDEGNVRFSPDGRYIAFASNELGRYEVFIAPYPVTGEKTRVSAGGGGLPRWSRDGRELFFVTADRHFVAMPVRTSPSLTLGTPQPLFAVTGGTEWTDPRATAVWSDFDVSSDGKRFLAAVPRPSNEQPLTAVLNWPQAVAHK